MHSEMNHKKTSRWRPFNKFLEHRTFSYKVVVCVTFVIIGLVMFQGLASTQLFWKVGDVASRTVTADRSVVYEDTEATKAKKEAALNNFEDVYQINLDQFNNLSLVAIDRTFEDLQKALVSEKTATKDDKQVMTEEKERRMALDSLLKSEVSDEDWAELSTYTDEHIELLHRQAVAISSNVMGKGVKEGQLNEAKAELLENVDQSYAFSDLDRRLVHRILENTKFYPTSEINQEDTEVRRQEILASVDPVFYTIQKDQVIVNKGDTISAEQYAALQALSNNKERSPYKIALGMLLTMMLLFVGLSKFNEWRGRHKSSVEWQRNVSIILVAMTIIIVLFPVISAIQIGTNPNASELVNFLIPIPAVTVMIAILLGNDEAVFVTLLMGVLVGLYTNDVYVSFANVAGSLMALTQVKVVYRRTDLTMSAVYAVGGLALVACIYALMAGLDTRDLLVLLAYCVGNGFLTLMLTIGLLPYLETAFNVTTSLTLMELCDPNTPLQRDLMNKAAGTYQHSLMVANLAEAAALRIGADAQLVRTAAYYHDIGKIKRPEFFSENQMTYLNPHDNLAPTLSTLIITSHVKDGVAMAKEARLPQPIIDMIGQHHGNTVVGYFYHKAKKLDPDINMDDFRYNCKRPQTREAAILMIADTVEAAVRSNINRLSHGQIESFIRNLINDKMNDKQFIECNLTYRDIRDITDEMMRMINSIYHKRVAYPDKKSLLK